MKKVLILAILALALIATPAMAKEGFYLGGFIPFNHITGSSADPNDDFYIHSLDDGAGIGIRAGYGFNRYVSLEGSLFRTIHQFQTAGIEDQDFTGATLDLKVNLPLTGSPVEPYFLLGVGSYELGDSGGSYKGYGHQFGIGADFYVAPELSLNAGLTWRKITFDSGSYLGFSNMDADVTTFDIGITYHFL